ncbi:hypothetical protein TURU_072207 [Turdus rufiventris]|nr:hypothetical protein TURU_072207 [Turdus rufiventris]
MPRSPGKRPVLLLVGVKASHIPKAPAKILIHSWAGALLLKEDGAKGIRKVLGFQVCLPSQELILPKGDLGSAVGWIKRFVGTLNLAAASHSNRSHFAPVWEDKGTRNERRGAAKRPKDHPGFQMLVEQG